MWPENRIAILADRVVVAAGKRLAEVPVAETRAEAVFPALAEALSATACSGRARIVLSHAVAPVWLLEAPAIRLGWHELRGWAREQMRGRIELDDERSQLAVEQSPPGRPLLVSMLDRAWLDGLTMTLAGRGVRAGRVEPWLARAGNRWRGTLRRGGHWLVLAEPGCLTMAFFLDGWLRTVRVLASGQGRAAGLADAIRREGLLAGLPADAPVWLADAGEDQDWRDSGLSLRTLPGCAPGVQALLGA